MSDITWNYDVEAAKTGEKVFGCVDPRTSATTGPAASELWIGWTRWIEAEQRWAMIGSKKNLLCWANISHPMADQVDPVNDWVDG